jgi:nitrous oxidase accessory protein NosD
MKVIWPVRLDWDSNPRMNYWNEICAWTIEHFGLPGGRYTTFIDADHMIWKFHRKEDQLLFILAWGNDDKI